MVSYKVVLVVVALVFGAGVCSTVAVNYFFPGEEKKLEAAENPEDARRAEMRAKYCEFYKDTPGKPMKGCE